MLLSLLVFLLFAVESNNPQLSARIQQMFDSVLSGDDDKAEKAIVAELQTIFGKQGLPAIAAVGDEAAYKFVFLTCSPRHVGVYSRVLQASHDGARRNEIPADAATFCAAHVRQEQMKVMAEKRSPTQPLLKKQLKRLYEADQAVREKKDFDVEKMTKVDRDQAAALEGILLKYGVPSYEMVGPEGVSHFVVMVQHQSPVFRQKVLPRLKANVDIGQADAGSYAMMLDRSLTDQGKPQVYGENLICDAEHPELHVGSIQDKEHVNERRAAIGLMRLELYAQLVVKVSPKVCGAVASK